MLQHQAKKARSQPEVSFLVQKHAFSITMKVAWGDMDAFGHVNNVAFVRYFENARAEFFSQSGIWKTPQKPVESGPVLVDLQLRYRGQVVFPASLAIHTGLAKISSRGFEMHCSMWNESGHCVCEGRASIIWFDFKRQKPARLPASFVQLQEQEA